jgi:MATE family multidrug resistance protein
MALAVPALGALAADPLYSLADTALVGNLGTTELGAVAVGTAAFTASFWLFSFLAYGVTPRVAGALGANRPEEASTTGTQALILAVAIGIVLTAIGIAFPEPIVRLLGADDQVSELGANYLRIRILSATAVLIAQVAHGWLRGLHNTKTPMIVAVSGAVLNAVLDYVLIYPAGLGVQGAAWATVIGQWLVALTFLAILAPKLSASKRPDARTIKELLKVGADLVIRTGSLLAALTIATSVAARMGVTELASWQIAMQVWLLLSLTLDSVAIAGQALVARYLGARTPDRATDVGRRLMTWGLLVGLVLAVAITALSQPIADIFSNDADVVAAATSLLVWVGVTQPLSSAAFTLDGILIGASDTRFLAKAMVASSVLFVGGSLLALDLDWGTGGLAAAATVWLLARAGTTTVRFVGGRWALETGRVVEQQR